jgi:hypothetical protein
MKTRLLSLFLLLISASAYAQHGSDQSFTYEVGLTGTRTLDKMWFTHEIGYTYWFAPYMGVNGALRLDSQGRTASKLGGTGTIDGFGNTSWDCHPPVRFALGTGISLATPPLSLKNTDIFLFCDPKIYLTLPMSYITATVYYPNGTLDTKRIKAKAQWISPEIDLGLTFRFNRFSVSPGYSFSLYDPYSGHRRMEIGSCKVGDSLPQFRGFNHGFFLRFTIHAE